VTGWPTATIGGACTVFSGGTPSKGIADYWRGTIPWVSAKDLKADRIFDAELHISQKACDQSATKMAPIGALLMLVRGMGLANGIQVGEVTAPVAFNQDLRAIVPPPTVDSRFLLLALRHRLADGGKGVLSAAAHGTLKIDADALRRVEFPVPPLHEQARIVAILDEAFEGIATAKANAEKNLQNARELFEASLDAVFTRQDVDWERAKLQDVCTLYNGRAYSKDELLTDGKYPVLRVGNFFTNRHWYYSDLELDEHKYCDTGDLLYAWSASFGPRIWDGGKVIFHYHIWKVVPRADRVEKDFLKHLLEWDTEKIKAAQGTGTTMMHVGKGSMDARVVPVPPLPVQRRIVAQLGALEQEVGRLMELQARKVAALDELKKSLLGQAFTGELTARTADRQVAELL
jgi:type I restriction enzyme, S subunit